MANNQYIPPGTFLGKRREPLGKKRCRIATIRQNTEKELWWTHQYKQGVSRDDTGSVGCGMCTFGPHSQNFDFKSPYEGKMRIEIMDGGVGGIRICGPEFWGGILGKIAGQDHGDSLIFMMPFSNIAEIVIQELPKKPKASERRSRVFIVPTGAVGLSSITRHIPQIIDFEMPHDWEPDPVFDKDKPRDCVDYLRQACDKLLERHGKKCIDIGEDADDQLCCSATWNRISRSKLGEEGADKGVIHFLPSGVFWQSEEQREDGTPKHIYIPLSGKRNQEDTPLAKSIKISKSKNVVSPKSRFSNTASLHITGVQYSLVHGDQFRQHPIYESSPGCQPSAKDIKQLEKDNATSSSTVECDLLVFEGLPMEEQDRIEQYIRDRYPAVATGMGEGKVEKSSEQKDDSTSEEKLKTDSKTKKKRNRREALEGAENVPSHNTRSKKRKVSS